MTDTTQDVQTSSAQQENAVQSSSLDPSLKSQLDYAFATPQELAQMQQQAQQPAEQQEGAQSEQASPATETVVDPVTALFQEFNVTNKDELKAIIEERNALKVAPPKTAELTFANDESKRIAEYLAAGKIKEVKEYLDGQEMFAGLDSMSEEQRLKLYIKMQNPLFDNELIEDEFNSLYTVDEDKFDDKETIAYKKENIRLQQRKLNDLQKAAEHFKQYQNKIELPQLQSIQPEVDEDYAVWKEQNAQQAEVYNTVIVPKVNALKESDFASVYKINDQNNQMNFDVTQVVDKATLDKAKAYALNFAGYMQEKFYNANNELNEQNLVRFILRNELFDNFVQTTASQAVNAERRRLIEKETPSNAGQRGDATTVVEKSDFQKQMDFSLSV